MQTYAPWKSGSALARSSTEPVEPMSDVKAGVGVGVGGVEAESGEEEAGEGHAEVRRSGE